MPLLFQPIHLGDINLTNKIVIAPICDTQPMMRVSWAIGMGDNGPLCFVRCGLCIVEATAVQAVGRISFADLGLWNDLQRAQMKALLRKVKTLSPMPFAIQLAHAGRKASTDRPWSGKGQIKPNEPHGWRTVSASDVPFKPEEHAPHALSVTEMQDIIDDFASAAVRAVDAGFELIELHAAHGYLLHQFMSPLSNRRTNEYGGSFENRIRFTLEVFQAIKQAVPENYPVGIRLSATDWMESTATESWDIDSTVGLSKALEQLGAAYIHISSGGLHVEQDIQIKPKYQVPFAHAVKRSGENSSHCGGLDYRSQAG